MQDEVPSFSVLQRSPSHVLEEKSHNRVRDIVPPEWVAERVRTDYGIDWEIWITSSNRVTNEALWVQVKATATNAKKTKLSFNDLPVGHLEFYECCRLPVALFLYVEDENALYGLLLQRAVDELERAGQAWRGQRTATIEFGPETHLDSATAIEQLTRDGYEYLRTRPSKHQLPFVSEIERPRQHVLETEADRALRRTLPEEWILRDVSPDYGIDFEVVLTEPVIAVAKSKDAKTRRSLTNAVTASTVWLQSKATEAEDDNEGVEPSGDSSGGLEPLTFRIKTKHLLLYERCHVPVLVVRYVKERDQFFYVFAQEYIDRVLRATSHWRARKTAKIRFDRPFDAAEVRDRVAAWQLSVTSLQVRRRHGDDAALYFVDGILASDQIELKERFGQALDHMLREDFAAAKKDLRDALDFFTVSPAERASVQLTLANAHTYTADYQAALRSLEIARLTTGKLQEPLRSRVECIVLTNTGVVRTDCGELDAALTSHEAGLKIAIAIADTVSQAVNLNGIGQVHKHRGELKTARTKFEESRAIASNAGYREGEAAAVGNIGVIDQMEGRYDDAHKRHEESYKISSEIGSAVGCVTDLSNIAKVMEERGWTRKALEAWRSAVSLARELGCGGLEQAMLDNMGVAYRTLGDLAEAEGLHREALALARKLGIRTAEARIRTNLANVLRMRGKPAEARAEFQSAITICDDVGDRLAKASALADLGLTHLTRGEPEQALPLFTEALAINEAIGYRLGVAKQRTNIGLVKKAAGRLPEAVEEFRMAIAIGDELDVASIMASNLGNVGLCFIDDHRYREAREPLEHSLNIFRNLEDGEGEANQLLNLGRLSFFERDFEKAVDYARNALRGYERMGLKKGMADAGLNLGIALGASQRFDEALAVLVRATRDYMDADLKGDAARAHEQVALAQAALNRPTEAVRALEDASALWKLAGSASDEMRVLDKLGVLHDDLGDATRALEAFGRARVIGEGLPEGEVHASVLLNTGNVHAEHRQFAEAQDCFRRAARLPVPRARAMALYSSGRAYRDAGDAPRAIEALQQSVQLNLEDGDVSDAAEGYGVMAGIALQRRDALEALRLLRLVDELVRTRNAHYEAIDQARELIEQLSRDH